MRSGGPDRHLHWLKSGYSRKKTNSPQSRKERKEIL
jgi:hypothetical protein